MALINCPECNAGISEQATSCPQCAFPISGTPKEKTVQISYAAPSSGRQAGTPLTPASFGPIKSAKSMGLAMVLSILFGPLGMFYASVKAALITLGIVIVLTVLCYSSDIMLFATRITFLSFGAWLASVIATAVIVSKHNNEVKQQQLMMQLASNRN